MTVTPRTPPNGYIQKPVGVLRQKKRAHDAELHEDKPIAMTRMNHLEFPATTSPGCDKERLREFAALLEFAAHKKTIHSNTRAPAPKHQRPRVSGGLHPTEASQLVKHFCMFVDSLQPKSSHGRGTLSKRRPSSTHMKERCSHLERNRCANEVLALV